MAIKNNICNDCDHQFVCSKLNILSRFDDDSKKYIGVDISINHCRDFMDTDSAKSQKDGVSSD